MKKLMNMAYLGLAALALTGCTTTKFDEPRIQRKTMNELKSMASTTNAPRDNVRSTLSYDEANQVLNAYNGLINNVNGTLYFVDSTSTNGVQGQSFSWQGFQQVASADRVNTLEGVLSTNTDYSRTLELGDGDSFLGKANRYKLNSRTLSSVTVYGNNPAMNNFSIAANTYVHPHADNSRVTIDFGASSVRGKKKVLDTDLPVSTALNAAVSMGNIGFTIIPTLESGLAYGLSKRLADGTRLIDNETVITNPGIDTQTALTARELNSLQTHGPYAIVVNLGNRTGVVKSQLRPHNITLNGQTLSYTVQDANPYWLEEKMLWLSKLGLGTLFMRDSDSSSSSGSGSVSGSDNGGIGGTK